MTQTKKLIPFILIFLLALAFFPNLVYAESQVFGHTTLETSNLGSYTWSEYCEYTSNSSSGTLTSISIGLNDNETNCYVAIFSDNGSDYPANRLGMSAAFTSSAGFNTVVDGNLTSVSITASTEYWLYIVASGDVNCTGSGGTVYERYDGGVPPITVPGTGSSARSEKVSIFATYMVAATGKNENLTLAENLKPLDNASLGKESAFWKIENIFLSPLMAHSLLAITIDVAVAIGVLALVLSIIGISMGFLRRRRY